MDNDGKRRRTALAMLVWLGCAGLSGYRQPAPSAHLTAQSMNTLIYTCKLVNLGGFETKEPAPILLPELVDWLKRHASADEPYIDYRQKTIEDAWGNQVVIVSTDGRFVGIGSPGPDGIWQGGSGDDMIVKVGDHCCPR